MTNNNYYNEGSYNIICDRCGQKKKREQCKKEWTGLLVCQRCWDPRHPWTLALPIAIDGLPVKDARPRPNTVYVLPYGIYDLSIWGGSYVTHDGILSNDITWEGFDAYWEGDTDLPYNSTNFPLV